MNNILKAKKALKDPNLLRKFLNLKFKEYFLWNSYYDNLRDPKLKCNIKNDPAMKERQIQNLIADELKRNNFHLIDYQIDVSDYRLYLKNAQYDLFQYYFGGKAANFPEKSLEHYLAAKLLCLNNNDIYIDIAAADSPVAEIYKKLFGCEIYFQDFEFPPGLNGNIIGGDASALPLENEAVSKLGLHCSFEHFEQDSDKNFIREAGRVLKKGGKLCILPLYLFSDYAIRTNPVIMPKGHNFDGDAILFCTKDWKSRYSRFYDIPHLISRISSNSLNLKMTIFTINNAKEVDPSCYVKFAVLFEKI